MKVYLYIILNIFFLFAVCLNENIIDREIKYKIIKYPLSSSNSNEDTFEPDLQLSEGNAIIELDSDFIITQISWTKKDSYKYNYLLGVFEASNDPSFEQGIPIAIIKEKGDLDTINYLNVDSPNSFKYLRYIPPNKNNTQIFPLKLYGHQKLNNENFEEKKLFQVSNLPLILIHTENSTEPGNDDKDVNCTITIINNGTIENFETAEIKVRGMSSSFAPKKPYRIKFSSKQKILNIKGKEKKWVLLANYYDRSLLRNALAFKISELMNFSFTPRCQPVDVILNGNFRGNYFICDKIDVISKNRLQIEELQITDNSFPNITGGYFLQIDARAGFGWGRPADQVENFIFVTDKGIRGQIVLPKKDELTKEQENYIKEKLNQFEDEIYNGTLDSIDLESYSKFFLVEEFCADPDHVYSSLYFTKDRNDDKFRFGPVWDFDLALDNDRRLIPTNEKPEFSFNYGSSSGTFRDLVKTLLANREAIEYIYDTWTNLCNSVLNETVLVDFLEEKKLYLKESSELNFLKWDHYVEEGRWGRGWGFGFGRNGEDFETSVEVLKDYVHKRFESLTTLLQRAVSLAN